MSTAPAPGGQVIAQLRGEQRSKTAANASFFRMLRIARPHWRILTLGLILSLGVALTYAGTLVGVLPVLKVLVEQQNLHDYLLHSAKTLEETGTWKANYAGLLTWVAGWFPPAAEGSRMQTLLMLMGGLIGLNVLGNTLRFLSQYFILYGCNRSLMDLRRVMYRQALRMPLMELSGDMSKMISQFLSDVREVYLGMVILFGRVAREPLKAIAVLTAALVLDARLTLIVLAIMPPAVGLLWFFGRKIRKATVRLLQGYGLMLVGLEESLQGLDVVKSYAREGHERQRMWQLERTMLKHQNRLALVEAMSSPLIEVLGIVFASAGIIWLASRTFSGDITSSHFMTMVVLLTAMLDPIRKVANVYNTVQRAGAAAARIYETLDRPTEKTPANPKPLPIDAAPAISLRDVTFRYQPDRAPALDHVSLEVAAGECVALVGPNGSGKTTLVRLLPRLITPEAGSVLWEGVDTAEVSLKQLREQIAVVTQHAVIFARSVKENIAYGKPDASDEEIREAARKAHASDFVESWPEKYETRVGEAGASMSGGQRQRLAIARAVLKPAQVLVFDEATSQVDAESEAKIHEALHELKAGKTTFLIAHRHTVMDMADRIVVMDQGQIVDVGTREELLERCPLFEALYRAPTHAS